MAPLTYSIWIEKPFSLKTVDLKAKIGIVTGLSLPGYKYHLYITSKNCLITTPARHIIAVLDRSSNYFSFF